MIGTTNFGISCKLTDSICSIGILFWNVATYKGTVHKIIRVNVRVSIVQGFGSGDIYFYIHFVPLLYHLF
jgi:hypothetical protein